MVTETQFQCTHFTKLPNQHMTLQDDNFIKFLSLSIYYLKKYYFFYFLHKQKELLDGDIGTLVYFYINGLLTKTEKSEYCRY